MKKTWCVLSKLTVIQLNLQCTLLLLHLDIHCVTLFLLKISYTAALLKNAGHNLPDALLMLVLFLDSSSSLESNPESGRSHSEPLCRWPPGTTVTAAAGVAAVVMDWFRENVFCSSTSLVFFSSIIQSAKWWSSVAPFAASSFGSRKGVLEWVSQTCKQTTVGIQISH